MYNEINKSKDVFILAILFFMVIQQSYIHGLITMSYTNHNTLMELSKNQSQINNSQSDINKINLKIIKALKATISE